MLVTAGRKTNRRGFGLGSDGAHPGLFPHPALAVGAAEHPPLAQREREREGEKKGVNERPWEEGEGGRKRTKIGGK